jgi:hypothetical protein
MRTREPYSSCLLHMTQSVFWCEEDIHFYDYINYWPIYIHEGESVNRLQMAVKRKTWYSKLRKTFLSRCTLNQQWYICPIVLPLRRNPQHRSFLTVVSATSSPTLQPLHHQRNLSYVPRPSCEGFTWETLPTLNRKHFLWLSFELSHFARKRTQQNAVLR